MHNIMLYKEYYAKSRSQNYMYSNKMYRKEKVTI